MCNLCNKVPIQKICRIFELNLTYKLVYIQLLQLKKKKAILVEKSVIFLRSNKNVSLHYLCINLSFHISDAFSVFRVFQIYRTTAQFTFLVYIRNVQHPSMTFPLCSCGRPLTFAF